MKKDIVTAIVTQWAVQKKLTKSSSASKFIKMPLIWKKHYLRVWELVKRQKAWQKSGLSFTYGMEKILEYSQVEMLELVLFNIFMNNLEKQVCSETPNYPDLTTTCSKMPYQWRGDTEGLPWPEQKCKVTLERKNPFQNRLYLHSCSLLTQLCRRGLLMWARIFSFIGEAIIHEIVAIDVLFSRGKSQPSFCYQSQIAILQKEI